MGAGGGKILHLADHRQNLTNGSGDVVHANRRHRSGRHVAGENRGRGLAFSQLRCAAAVGDEGQLIRPRRLQRGNTGDHGLALAFELPAEPLGQLTDR